MVKIKSFFDKVADLVSQGKLTADDAFAILGLDRCPTCKKGGKLMGKVIKVDDAFYEKIKSLAEQGGVPIGEMVETAATPALTTRKRFDELRKECADGLGICVADDPVLEERLLQIVPPGQSPVVDEVRKVYACALEKLLEAKETAPEAEETGEETLEQED